MCSLTSGKIGQNVQTEPSHLDITSGKIGHFVQIEPSLLDIEHIGGAKNV